ncbi:NAD(P)/FAD-dependent oxidoreductase [Arthrobacter sp. CAN_C5]|uniref:phytoene desaturase family protein n=1 Tax=Arthrobacter sp. CAN_C5 TaxID=2760706 RepID=UPI001AE5B051|nr:NAD(P)/FAD-dependent oxidoreductase [Arthrobacter sp. CAN_C5]MBP2215397.1 phytoene dehydrogenase-like protein [Arthrobacter sp. CAN_C5]
MEHTSGGHEHFDVVVVGGGHNGLVAASYLAKSGRSVVVLERQDQVGGAAVSAEPFPGTGARISRYSYLVSLFPQQIIDDLGLDLTLVRRRYSSYTPLPGSETGLLIDNEDHQATRDSFRRVGAGEDADKFNTFYARTAVLAEKLWPTVTGPLLRRSEARKLVGDDGIWNDFIDQPLGQVIERTVDTDLVRGVLLTDGLISTFARAHDEDLQQNKCFLYHVVGGGTGDWDVPVGGMGAVSGALERAALAAGVVIRTQAEVTAVAPNGVVHYRESGVQGPVLNVTGGHVLANVTPAVLGRLMGGPGAEGFATTAPAAEGAQVKVNLLLSRLPRLKDPTVQPEQAFGGTFHINELYSQLDTAYSEAEQGRIPSPLPIEIYCHSLADPSILSDSLRASGAQTLTVFSLQTPHRLTVGADHATVRAELQAAVLASLNSVLAEPIEDCVLLDGDGRPCIETKTTLDLEEALGLTGGNIFHGRHSAAMAVLEEQ